MRLFNPFKKRAPPKRFPPVPDWRPEITLPLDRIADRLSYYTKGAKDFAIFEHGTCVLLEDGLSDQAAEQFAKDVLYRIIHAHPDMQPLNMNDGNILVQYNHPALSIVLSDIANEHWPEIDRRHQEALATSEVLITPLGQNKFDETGKKALFGRCFMFMDAQNPKMVRVEKARGHPPVSPVRDSVPGPPIPKEDTE